MAAEDVDCFLECLFDFCRGIGECLGDLFGLGICQVSISDVVYKLCDFFGVEGC